MDYLLKTEPTAYSFSDLQKDGVTEWDGVANPAALKNMREMQPGDNLIIYETGDTKSAVGMATVVSVDASDPIDLLRFAISDLGHTQAELAALLGSRSRASEVLNRRRALTVEMIRTISEAWKIPTDLLVKPSLVAA